MGKINFTKAEKALDLNSRQRFIEKIIAMTEKEQASEKEEQEKAKNKHMASILRTIQGDLGRLSEKSEAMWAAIGMSKEEISRFIENPGTLTAEDRELIKRLMEKIQDYKKTTGKSLEQEINEDIVEQEREKHQDKRININQKWKPI